jgi:3-hydroxyacyl-CoA dehydrogenase/3-hydroxy-2-methylbutyryl-CoA dehydrogenase
LLKAQSSKLKLIKLNKGTTNMYKHVVAVISGGASGLGAATASYLVKNGARVICADLPQAQEHYLKLEASFNENCRSLKFSQADVRSEDDILKALDMAEEEFGEQVNVAVNCAGIAPARKTLSQKVAEDGSVTTRLHSLEEFSKTIEVNTVGTFNLSRLAAYRMSQRTADENGLRGCIINTASVAAYDGQIGQVAYASSKGGVVSLTLPLARDLASIGVRVMTIAPGLFMTPLLSGLPEKVHKELVKNVPCPNRLGDPIYYAQLVGSIVTNPYLNGEVIRLDGALRMPP